MRHRDAMTAVPRSAPTRPAPRAVSGHRLWIPRQHGAWAMLLVPLLLGVAASRASGWQLVVGGAALAAYLASATAQAWSRARRPPEYRAPLVVYGTLVAILGGVLLVAFPALVLAGAVVATAGLVALLGARPGTRRDLANSLAQVAQAVVLVPVAAWVSGAWDAPTVVAMTAVAAATMAGSVLVVRSVLRERANPAFAATSVGVHAAFVVAAALLLPGPYAVLAGALAARAVALPLLQRRLAGGRRPLRPVHVGMVELAASVAVVAVAFAVPVLP